MKHFTRRTVAALALATGSVGLVACGDDGGSSGTNEIVIGYLPFAEQMQIKLADQEGIFSDHDIKVSYGNAAATGPQQMAQLLNGQLDAAITTIGSVITAQASGVDVKVVGSVSQDYDRDGATAYNIVVPADSPLQTLGDLEGKTVAINTLASTYEVDLKESVEKSGGNPDNLDLVQITFPNMAAALRDKQVDAAYLIQPFASGLIAEGYRSIGDSQATALDDPESTSTVLVMSTKFLEENPETARRFVEAMDEASDYANENPDAVLETLATEADLDPAVAAKSPVPSYVTAVDEENIEKWIALFEKYGVIDEAPALDDVLWDDAITAE